MSVQTNPSVADISTDVGTWMDLARVARRKTSTRLPLGPIAKGLARKDQQVLIASQNSQIVAVFIVQLRIYGKRTPHSRLQPQYNDSNRPLGPETILMPVHIGVIRELVILPRYAKQQIAASLIDRALKWLAHRQTYELRKTISWHDKPTRHIFESMDFSPLQILVRRETPANEQPRSSCIRHATVTDLPQLCDLVRRATETQQRIAKCFQLRPDVDWDEYVASRIGRPDWEILVAEQGGRLFGHIEIRTVVRHSPSMADRLKILARSGNRESVPDLAPKGIIEEVYVVPDRRRTGIGSALLHGSYHWFRKRRVTHIHGAIWHANHASRSLSQTHGFEPDQLLLRRQTV